MSAAQRVLDGGRGARALFRDYRVTQQQRRFAATLVAFAVLPPIAGRILPDHWIAVRSFELGTAASLALAAMSLNILMGYAGQISLGHGAFLGVGAFASGLITARGPEAPFLVGLVVAAVIGAAFAFVVGLPALRLRGLYLAIATIGFAFLMQHSLFKWGPITGGSAGLEVPRPKAGTFVFSENADYLALALVIVLAVWAIDANIVRTKFGRAFQAIRSDESVAQSFGIDVARYKLLAFVISGALAGIAGAVFGHLVGFVGSESFTFESFSLLLVIVVVVGGLGSRTGVVVAAAGFAILPRALKFLHGWDLIIGPLLLIDVLTRHPGGLAAALREAREKKAEKRARAGAEGPIDDSMPKLPNLPRPSGLPERPDVVAGAPILEVRDVSVRFGGLQAVDGASLTVPKGKIVGLIGPNGAGKTTLFNVVSGFVRPESGSVRFLGREISTLPPHERSRLGMGRTFQQIGLAKDRSVHENFLLAQHAVARYGVPAGLLYAPNAGRMERELDERAHEAVAALGFERYSATPVGNLSHGQQRLVELGCALVTAPELLLLDEPSAGMAPAAVENLAQRLRDIRDELGRTVLLIEHHIPLVLDVCDEIYVLNVGRVLAHGTTDEIARQPEVIAAYFGEAVAV